MKIGSTLPIFDAKLLLFFELCKKKSKKVMFGGYFLSLGSGKVNFFAYFPFPFPLSARLELYISRL